MSGTRRATHAGSWYSADPRDLSAELASNLSAVHPLSLPPPIGEYSPPDARVKALIAPHAGYAYSGGAGAWAYKGVDVQLFERVWILGPSHHKYLNTVALSKCARYATPLGDLELDTAVIAELRKTGQFDDMSTRTDEEEHSIEMHLPYVRHVFESEDEPSRQIKVIPLLVGSVSASKMDEYARILAPYYADPASLWIISSDFCHWGTRFSHTPYYPTPPPSIHPPLPPSFTALPSSSTAPDPTPLNFSDPSARAAAKTGLRVWESIEALDREGMEVIRTTVGKQGGGQAFRAYLRRTENTICGRNPILLLLAVLEHRAGRGEGDSPEIAFVRYEQSSRCERLSDSSVSYVSAVVREG